MITYEQAIQKIFEISKKKNLSQEKISVIENVNNRVLAQDVFSVEANPPFDNSAMDGFLVSHKHIGYELEVVAKICAGEFSNRIFNNPMESVEIMTGSCIPYGILDSVIKVEDCEVQIKNNKKFIKLCKNIQKAENIRFKGEDFKENQKLFLKNQILKSEHILTLSSLGIPEISVYRKPKIILISTGKELVSDLNIKLTPGFIRNSSAPFLINALNYLGCEVKNYGVVLDDVKDFFNKMERALDEKPDLIITTGAVSMGAHDFITHAISDLKAETVFHKVAIRPGKPILFGHWDGRNTSFFGFPGNPISSQVALRFFVCPYLSLLKNEKQESPLFAKTTNEFRKPKGLNCFYKSYYNQHKNEVTILKGQASFMVSPLLDSNSFVELSGADEVIQKDELVKVHSLLPNYNFFEINQRLIHDKESEKC